MTIYCLKYRRDGQDVTERFESMTARNLRVFELPVYASHSTWLESFDVEPRNQAVVVQRMSLADLPVMGQWNRTHGAVQKADIPTKLDRAVEKKAATREDEQKLRAWAAAVKFRDNYKDRFTGKKVKATRLVLDPDAGHAHHIEPRENMDTRYDVRNGLTLSAATHDAVERNKLRIIGTRVFTVHGVRYIDATFHVSFKKVSA